MSLIQGARYLSQSVRTLKNLSRPKAMGAIVKTVRSSRKAWRAPSGLTSGCGCGAWKRPVLNMSGHPSKG